MITYDKSNPLRVVTLCSGYDSQCMALERLKERHPEFEYDLIAWSEIDRYAIKAHDAVFPQYADRNLGDMTKIDWSTVPDFDFLTYSTPCTDLSNAGLQKGMEEGSGTRSSILWYTRNAILAKKPKYLMLENVQAMVSGKFFPYFLKWLAELKEYGYTNYWQVLNAKDYGVPQNRERVFVISIRDEHEPFYFPPGWELDKCLKDVLEENVAEKYYLPQDKVDQFIAELDDEKKKLIAE